MICKIDDSIWFWNFEDLVDKEKFVEVFIYCMINNDFYFFEEKVLLKYSFIYEKFMVYNELIKVRYKNE